MAGSHLRAELGELGSPPGFNPVFPASLRVEPRSKLVELLAPVPHMRSVRISCRLEIYPRPPSCTAATENRCSGFAWFMAGWRRRGWFVFCSSLIGTVFWLGRTLPSRFRLKVGLSGWNSLLDVDKTRLCLGQCAVHARDCFVNFGFVGEPDNDGVYVR